MQTVAGVGDNFRTFKTLDVPFRRRQLENLRKLVTENKQKIFDALYTDLHKVSWSETPYKGDVDVSSVRKLHCNTFLVSGRRRSISDGD